MNNAAAVKINRAPTLFHDKQIELFYQNRHKRFKIVPKGRRWGFTQGAMQYVISRMRGGVPKDNPLPPVRRVLWGDTINSNIDRYVSRYGMPLLRRLPKGSWKWSKRDKELTIVNVKGEESTCDFRSEDAPERWEGFGYGLIVLNEAGIILKNVYLWENAVLPMAMDYKAEMIVGGTPKGKKDKKREAASGNPYTVFYELAERGTEGSPTYNPDYGTFVFTTYDNPLLDKAEVDKYVATVPAATRNQEVFATFEEDGLGNVFLKEWWKFYDATTLPSRDKFKLLVASLDSAFKDNEENDFSVLTIWGIADNGYYLLDMWRERALYPDLKRMALSLPKNWGVDYFLIEDKASGTPLIQELKRGTRLNVREVGVGKDKLSRASANTPIIESGNVFVPDPLWQPWARDFIEEHSEFPNGEFDDIVDSTSQALAFMKTKGTGGKKEARLRWV